MLRLKGSADDSVGVLCLADRGKHTTSQDEQLLQAIAGHASVALENARLFTRMDQANRHWMEIFDAISDFIVVHDEADNVLRVNRSLAEFIGVGPSRTDRREHARAAGADDATSVALLPILPFVGRCADEYVHPVLERTYLVSTSRIHGASGEAPANDSCSQGHHRPSRGRTPLSRTVRQHPGRPVLLHVPKDASSRSTMPWCACWDTTAGKSCCRWTFPRSSISRPTRQVPA